MRASEIIFSKLQAKRILSFANLICSSVSGPKALKDVSAFCREKLWNVFKIVLESVCTKIALMEKNISKEKNLKT